MRYSLSLATLLAIYGFSANTSMACEAYYDATRSNLSLSCVQVNQEHFRADLKLELDRLPAVSFALTTLNPITMPPVRWQSTDLGDVLADANGMTLYLFDNDTPSHSNCIDACLDRWPPLLKDMEGMDMTSTSMMHMSYDGFSLITRDDGRVQWAYHGHPLYYWFEDGQVGDTLGDGVGDVWHVIHTSEANTQFVMTDIGMVLAAPNGMTLYNFDNDGVNKSNCNDDCATRWPPFAANQYSRTHGDYSVVTRDDGSLQWAYQGQPLYFWFEDQKMGDTLGDGVGDVWHVKHTEQAPVAFNVTAIGTVMTAASNGMTLYTFDNDQPSQSNCNDDCATRWPPLMADEYAHSHNMYSVITRNDGSHQWAYQGKPLYFWFEDTKAGDTLGDGVGDVWHVVYR